jgi:hypothetical protein
MRFALLAVAAVLVQSCAASKPQLPINSFGAAPVKADIVFVARTISGQLKSNDPSFVLPSGLLVELVHDGKNIAKQKSGSNGSFLFKGPFTGELYSLLVRNKGFSAAKEIPIEADEIKGLRIFVEPPKSARR